MRVGTICHTSAMIGNKHMDAEKLKELIELLDEMEKDHPMPMRCIIVSDDLEYQVAIERMGAEGRRLAAVSNAGLDPPRRRLTFLPHSAFTDSAQPTE